MLFGSILLFFHNLHFDFITQDLKQCNHPLVAEQDLRATRELSGHADVSKTRICTQVRLDRERNAVGAWMDVAARQIKKGPSIAVTLLFLWWAVLESNQQPTD
jgi:hypothetical protein